MADHQPSEAQLEILQILWEHEPSTVRFVHEVMSEKKEVGYTTILKQMQRMTEKGLIEAVSQQGKSHEFKALVKESKIRKRLFNQFKENVFKGSAMDLVMHALGDSKPSEEELAQLQQWLEAKKNDSQS
ncbi:MAG: BlaI/MecI/CopY family transcriptional regulator [Bacteroidia bacterium]|nr:BlaI/MecI/CopY family transcriptional regulator [Bacteroidia bacterium]